MTCDVRCVGVSDGRVQLARCLALGDACDGAGGEWEASGVCGMSQEGWSGLDDATLGLRQRLMDF